MDYRLQSIVKNPIKTIFILFLLVFIVYFSIPPEKLFNDPYSIVLQSRKGELLGAYIANDEQWRFPEEINVPDKIAKCLILYEDKVFC